MPKVRNGKKPGKKTKRAQKPRRTADSLTVSVLQATLESTADGILVVDEGGNVLSQNRRLSDMWRVAPSVIA